MASKKLSGVEEPKDRGKKKKKDKKKKKKNSSNGEDPNANIRFDDQHEEQQTARKPDKTPKSNQTKPKDLAGNNAARGRARNTSGPSPTRMNSPAESSIDDDASQVVAKISHNFPTKTHWDLFGKNETRTLRRRDIFADLVRQLNSVAGGGDDDDDEKDKLKLIGSASGGKASRASNDNSQLVRKEQVAARTISSTGSGLRQRNGSNRQQQELVYSNFIRIRCSSLVPTLGYEMISELNVPLTLMVPAGQLNDVQWQLLNANNRQQPQDRDLSSRRNDEVAEDDGGSTADRNGGSLQAPRAVSIDRVAQASGAQITTTATATTEQSPPVRATTNRTTRFLREARNGASSRTTTNCHLGTLWWWALIVLLCCYKAC